MQILVDVTPSSTGRLTGTAALAGAADVLAFSGNLELLARIEELWRRGPSSADDPSNSTNP
jgi:hypothetical protein